MRRETLCDVCMDPGHCCRDLPLRGGPEGPNGERVDSPMSYERAEHFVMSQGLPFRPLYRDDQGRWRWGCTALDQRTGRCTIYENRPHVCQIYDPGCDSLCVHHVPREPKEDDEAGAADNRGPEDGSRAVE